METIRFKGNGFYSGCFELKSGAKFLRGAACGNGRYTSVEVALPYLAGKPPVITVSCSIAAFEGRAKLPRTLMPSI